MDNLRFDVIDGKEFLVNVELLPKASEPLDKQSLWFKLDLEPDVKLIRVPPPTQTHIQSELSPHNTDTVAPQLECTDCYFTRGALCGWNVLTDEGSVACMVAQAEFHLKPIANAPPWVEIRSQIVFYGTDNVRLNRVKDGVWREQENVIQMPINTSDTKTLVIALEFNDAGFSGYEYATRAHRPMYNIAGVRTASLAPKPIPLEGDELTVWVRLVGKYLDNPRLDQSFYFKLSRPKLNIKQISRPDFLAAS